MSEGYPVIDAVVTRLRVAQTSESVNAKEPRRLGAATGADVFASSDVVVTPVRAGRRLPGSRSSETAVSTRRAVRPIVGGKPAIEPPRSGHIARQCVWQTRAGPADARPAEPRVSRNSARSRKMRTAVSTKFVKRNVRKCSTCPPMGRARRAEHAAERLSRLTTVEERHHRLFARLLLAFLGSLFVFFVGAVLIWAFESGRKVSDIHGFGDPDIGHSPTNCCTRSARSRPHTPEPPPP